MKITVKSLSPKGQERWYGRNGLDIYIDGKCWFSIWEGEPEDMTLWRDLRDCYKIPELMRRAYDAGKMDDDFEIENVEVDDLNE